MEAHILGRSPFSRNTEPIEKVVESGKSLHGELITYKLSPGEIESKYGTSAASSFTFEKYTALKRKGYNYRQMAEELKLNYEAVKALANKYHNQKEEQPLVRPAEPVESAKEIEKLTKELYSISKDEGLSNREIAKKYLISEATLYNHLKKWGLGKEQLKVEESKDESPKVQELKEITTLQLKRNVSEEEKAELIEAISKEPGRIEVPQDERSLGKFEQIGRSIGALVDEKNTAYGDSFAKTGDFLKLLYPNGIQPVQYTDALCVVRIFDKLMRIATANDAFGESPFKDIVGYGLLGAANSEMRE